MLISMSLLSSKYLKFGLVALIIIGLSSGGYLGWKHWQNSKHKPGSLTTVKDVTASTTTYDFHELGLKLTLPSELNGLEYNDLVSSDKTTASLVLRMSSYTKTVSACTGSSADKTLPIATLNRAAGKYLERANLKDNTELVRQLPDYFISISEAYPRKCKDTTAQTTYEAYDTKIRAAIKSAVNSAVQL